MSSFQDIIDQVINPNEFIVFYNLRSVKIDLFYYQLIKILSDKGRGLIIDLEHRFKPSTKTNVRILQPKNKDEQIKIFSELDQYINPRLKFIAVLGLPVFLSDYQGKTSTENLYNQRILAFCMAILKELASKVKVIVKQYEQGYKVANPQYPNVTSYYSDALVHLSEENEKIKITNITDNSTMFYC